MTDTPVTNAVGGYIAETYDPVAVEVMEDDTVAPKSAFGLSPQDMTSRICSLMRWEEFDLFAPHDFPAIYERGTVPELLAYAMLSYLRWHVFTLAYKRGVGVEAFNMSMAAYHEKWHRMLSEKWTSARRGEATDHKWLN